MIVEIYEQFEDNEEEKTFAKEATNILNDNRLYDITVDQPSEPNGWKSRIHGIHAT